MRKVIINISILAVIFITLFTATIILYINNRPARYAYIYKDNELVTKLKLSEDTTYNIDGNMSNMVIIVKDKKIWVEYSGCPNHDCMQMGKKSHVHDFILCAPNGVKVKLGD